MTSVDLVTVARVLAGQGHYLELGEPERRAFHAELARRARDGRPARLRGVETFAQVTPPPGGAEPACKGDERFTRLPVDLSLVEVCGACPVTDWCREVTQPHAHFDGICAGVAYRNGKAVAP